MTKERLRKRLLEKLRRQPKESRLQKSLGIARGLQRLTLYRKAKLLLCYVAIDGEVETRPIMDEALRDGKRVAVPVTITKKKRLIAAEIADVKQDLKKKGPFGIPEPRLSARRPIDPKRLDLILVPGVAFDKKGRRLGRGGGYFDRFLERAPARIPRVGLAFRFQVVKKLPVESHDQPVDKVVTEK